MQIPLSFAHINGRGGLWLRITEHGHVLVEEVLATHVAVFWLNGLKVTRQMVMNAFGVTSFLEDDAVARFVHARGCIAPLIRAFTPG